MSNKATRIKKVIKKPDALYNSLIGSIILTVGITTGRTERQCRTLFNTLRKNKQVLGNTVSDIMDYVWEIFGNDDLIKVRASYVLVYDSLGVRSPMVTFVDEAEHLMPLRKEGFKETNIISLAAEGRDWARAEYLYDLEGRQVDDDGEEIVDED